MAKRADFTIEPDLMKGEIDEHGKLREPFVRLPGEPDHWTFYLKVGDRVCYDYSRHSARRGHCSRSVSRVKCNLPRLFLHIGAIMI